MKKYVKKIKTKNFSKDTSQCTNFCKRCTASSRFQAFRNELSVILAANEKIAFWLQKKKFLTKSKNVTSSSILINVWVDIVEIHLVGPYVLPRRLNGVGYLQFLNDVLPELLEQIPLAI
jgi:hypothetical protein